MTWWSELYNDALADVLLDGTSAAEIAATVDFLVERLALPERGVVFDQCAGTGRLSIALARRGYTVHGVEQCAAYVERARAAAAGLDVVPSFVIGDAFEHVPARSCDGAFNWWTSFGYLPDDAGNARMLERAFEALVPGGRFALDLPNLPGVLASFRPHEITRRGELTILRETTLDLARGLMHKRWTFLDGTGRRVERPSTVRVYMPDQIASLLAAVGFTDVELVGGSDGQPLGLHSPRCIAIARRPPRDAR